MPTGFTFRNNTIAISTNTTTFTDISGWANEVQVGGGVRGTAEEFFFGTDTAQIAAGKRAPIQLTLIVMYTDISTDPFGAYFKPYYETSAPTPLYLKWTPRGSATGAGTVNVFTTDALWVTDPPYPGGQAKGDKIVTFTVKGTTSFVTTTTTSV